MADADQWCIEAEAACRTIDRMGRQMCVLRNAVQRIADGEEMPMGIAHRAILDLRKLDMELWKVIPHEGRTDP